MKRHGIARQVRRWMGDDNLRLANKGDLQALLDVAEYLEGIKDIETAIYYYEKAEKALLKRLSAKSGSSKNKSKKKGKR